MTDGARGWEGALVDGQIGENKAVGGFGAGARSFGVACERVEMKTAAENRGGEGGEGGGLSDEGRGYMSVQTLFFARLWYKRADQVLRPDPKGVLGV